MKPAKALVLLCLFLGFWAGQGTGAAASDLRLYMFYEPGCTYCAAWERDVGVVYSRTPQGRMAPLRRVFIGDANRLFPQFRRVIYTPTFIVARGSSEIGRITGYPGEDFFWWQLDEILRIGRLAHPVPGEGRDTGQSAF